MPVVSIRLELCFFFAFFFFFFSLCSFGLVLPGKLQEQLEGNVHLGMYMLVNQRVPKEYRYRCEEGWEERRDDFDADIVVFFHDGSVYPILTSSKQFYPCGAKSLFVLVTNSFFLF